VDSTDLEPRYHLIPAAAYVRARLPRARSLDDRAAVELGVQRSLAGLHRFKRGDLQRVARVLGILKGVVPESLLDIGCGRGAFLWPLVEAFPTLAVTAIDLLRHRLETVDAVRRGGLDRLSALRMDATALGLADDAFDAATALEVLEHLPDPAAAARELVRVARRFVVVSVPSKPDDNPGHLHLFDGDGVTALFLAAGAAAVRCEHVLNHLVAVVRLGAAQRQK
jgi:2-polyprenyl-3-methyl-5-hydroxy-6-metoxy-1,4-benzoquinol methylase